MKSVLSQLDVDNDNHWTAEGLPRLDTVRLLAKDPSITRGDISDEFPDFRRDNLDLGEEVLEPKKSSLQDEFEESKAQVEELQKAQLEIQRELVVALRKMDAANVALQAAFPKPTDAELIQSYLKAQKQAMQERGKSALDQAMKVRK